MIHLTVEVPDAAEVVDPSAYGVGSKLRWESSSSFGGTYVEGGTIVITGTKLEYDIWDPNGTDDTWYRTRISNAGGTTFSPGYSTPIQGGTRPRTAMIAMIDRIRTMIGDRVVATSVPVSFFSDGELQDALDERRTDVVEALLTTTPSFADVSGYTEFSAPRKWWEDNAVLRNAAGTVLTPVKAELLVGRWTFGSSQGGPVYITGRFYDMFGAATVLLEEWAAAVAREFDFATDQQTFDRSNKREGLLAVAAVYARRVQQPGARPAWRSAQW